jgi:hypothetical protein
MTGLALTGGAEVEEMTTTKIILGAAFAVCVLWAFIALYRAFAGPADPEDGNGFWD